MKYTAQGEKIQGKELFLTFEHRPQFSFEDKTGQSRVYIRGNPATATIKKVFVYNK